MDEISKRKQQPIAPIMNIGGASDDLGDVTVYYRIQQKNTKEYDAGKFSIENMQKETIKFVWLGLSLSRIKFPKYDPKNPNQKPLCKSNDGKLPSGGEEVQPGPCKTCPFQEWQIDGVGKSYPPKCSKVYNMLGWDIDEDMPFILPIKKTAIKYLKRIKSKLKWGAGKWGYTGLPTNYCVILKIQLEHNFQEGDFYVPYFVIEEKLPLEKAKFYFETAQGAGNFMSNLDPERSVEKDFKDLDYEDQEVPENIAKNIMTKQEIDQNPNIQDTSDPPF